MAGARAAWDGRRRGLGGLLGPVIWAALGLGGSQALAGDPVAENGFASLEPGGQVTLELDASDSDGDTLTYLIISPLPGAGTVSVGGQSLSVEDLPYTIPGNGRTIVYSADVTDHGEQAIAFKANDGTADSNQATVTISVNRPPIADATTTFFTKPSTDLKLTLPAIDPDGDTLVYTIESLPGHGRLKVGSTTLTDASIPYDLEAAALTYSPDADYHGQDLFRFTANDGEAVSATITLTIEVNTTPVPDNVSAIVLPNGTTTVTLSAVDGDKDAIVYLVASLPDHGTLSVGGIDLTPGNLPFELDSNTRTIEYFLEVGYRGTDTFHYRVRDAVSTSDRAVATIVVDTPPVATGSAFTVATGSAVEGKLTPTDADGDALSIRVTVLGVNGTLKLDGKTVSKTTLSYTVPEGGLSFSYTFTSGFEGTDAFIWVADDGIQESAPATVSLSVQATASQPAEDTSADNADTEVDSSQPSSPAGSQSAACGPLGTSFVMVLLAWAMIISPTKRNWDASWQDG